MTEEFLVNCLLQNGVKLPWRSSSIIRHLTEVKVTTNIVDVVYFEKKGESEIGSIVAVEAKVKNWRRALQQAYRDKLFADRVYVALPEEFSAAAISNLSEFKHASVGLIIVGTNKVRPYFDPPMNNWRSKHHVNIVKKELSMSETRNLAENLARFEDKVDLFQLTFQNARRLISQKLFAFANLLPHLL